MPITSVNIAKYALFQDKLRIRDRHDEESCPNAARSSPNSAQLVPRPGTAFQWRRGRPQHQCNTDLQKILRFSDLPCSGYRLVSRTWCVTRTKAHPQVLLTSQKFLLTREFINGQSESGKQCLLISKSLGESRNVKQRKRILLRR